MRLHAASLSLAVAFVTSGCSQLVQESSGQPPLPAAKVHSESTAGTVTTLYSFQGQPDGADPESQVFVANRCCPYYITGNTTSGGTNNAGTIYELSGTSTFRELYRFSYSQSVSGSDPLGPPVGGVKTFGTAAQGGSHNKGTLIEIYGYGISVTVHSFDGNDGALPTSGLGRTSLIGYRYYFTTYSGGSHSRGAILGVAHQRPNPKILYSFSGKGDGEHPNSVLSEAGYGTTTGSKSSSGTVFQFVPGTGVSTIFTFSSSQDGMTPTGVVSGLVSGRTAIFGTTVRGGSTGNGVLYEITQSGSSYTEQTLHNFTGASGDGAYPQGRLATAFGQHYWYGVTEKGGSGGCGTIFRIDLTGNNYQVVYSFKCGQDGARPMGGLATNPFSGAYIGTTSAGGTANKGTVFAYNPST